jgi:hypothetical protein
MIQAALATAVRPAVIGDGGPIAAIHDVTPRS